MEPCDGHPIIVNRRIQILLEFSHDKIESHFLVGLTQILSF